MSRIAAGLFLTAPFVAVAATPGNIPGNEPSPEYKGWTGKGSTAAKAIDDSALPLIRDGLLQPPQGLTGKELVIAQSHGRSYFPYPKQDTSVWVWRRPLVYGNREDLFAALIVNRWLLQYFKSAGAYAYTCRERDEQLNEMIADLNSTADALTVTET